jgi:aspartate/methionine/tyrosine aminotransferase
MHPADRVQRLDTETAFAVAAKAAAHAATGHPVYPFHLGDLNMNTPANVIEAANKAMRDGKIGYCPHPGIAPLRDALAQDTNVKRGTRYSAENVSIQPGGKPIIGKFLMTLMNEGDEVLCPNPGFPIY